MDITATGTIDLQSGQPWLQTSMQINGPGAGKLTVRRDAGSNYSIFSISGSVTISGLTVADSDRSGISIGDNTGTHSVKLKGVTVSGNTLAGGIFNGGTLEVMNSTISGNSSSYGSGISNSNIGSLKLINSTVSKNTAKGAPDSKGGGIDNAGTLKVVDSTVSANTVTDLATGGGILNDGLSTMTMTNSTVSDNSAEDTGGIHNRGSLTLTDSTLTNNTASSSGANLKNMTNGAATLENTIVANPQGVGANCGGTGTLTSSGENLDDGTSCGFTASGDLQNVDPKLGALQNNGGLTKTHALLAGSPAIDAADPSACLPTDQRGKKRDGGDNNGSNPCDIGAFELQVAPRVTDATPTGPGVKRNTNLTATFSEKMNPATLTTKTFKLYQVSANGSTTQVTKVKVTLSTNGLKATLDPFGTSATLLAANTKYQAVITTGAKDLAGNPLDQNKAQPNNQKKVWTFTTGTR